MRYFKLDPLHEDPIESGEIVEDEFQELYLSFPWVELLKKQNSSNQDDVKCSPGIILSNDEDKSVFVSIVGTSDDYEFYICYKRPVKKRKKQWFKTVEYIDKNHNSIISEQTIENGLEAFSLLFKEDYETLEKEYG